MQRISVSVKIGFVQKSDEVARGINQHPTKSQSTPSRRPAGAGCRSRSPGNRQPAPCPDPRRHPKRHPRVTGHLRATLDTADPPVESNARPVAGEAACHIRGLTRQDSVAGAFLRPCRTPGRPCEGYAFRSVHMYRCMKLRHTSTIYPGRYSVFPAPQN